ncbi:hypothetical protein [Escherichia coli]|uniref:hypothetical protein n=1 Tax=Escherichia coli TaxID=562 RepID=UPI002FCD5A2A
MMSSDTNIDYAALGEYTAFSDKARDAAVADVLRCVIYPVIWRDRPKAGVRNES